MSLDTLSNVKSRQGIATSADDALLDLLRDSADAFIAEFCGRDFEAGTFTEYHQGEVNVVPLRNYPVSSVTSVNADRLGVFGSTTLVPATDYIVDSTRGLIYKRRGLFIIGGMAPRAVQVVYVTSAAVPNDVKEAYAELVGHWYRHAKTQIAAQHQNITVQKIGATTAIFAKDQIAGLSLPPDVTRLLTPYRDLVI
jgi:hypothetical protein